MKKMKSNALAYMYAAAAAMSAQQCSYNDAPIEEPKKKIVPKGAKEFFFDAGGNIVADAEIASFTCIARTEQKAIEKFIKYKSNKVLGSFTD